MSNVEHTPSLNWTLTDFGDVAADLGNGERLVIHPIDVGVQLLLNGEYLNYFADPIAAMAYAKTWVGDE